MTGSAPKQSAAPPTLLASLKSAAGYFTVAIACAWAGYALRHQSVLITKDDLPLFALALAALLPAYVNRGILYELNHSQRFTQEDENRDWLRSHSIQLPVGLALLAIVAGLDIFIRKSFTSARWLVALNIILVSLPIYVINFRSTRRWLRDGRVFAFRFRSFFPAFATCLMPFTFAYSDFADVSCTTIAAAVIVMYWLVAVRNDSHVSAILGGSIFGVIVIWQIGVITHIAPRTECPRVLFFGTIMTLLMGVAEAWRVTTRILNDKDFRIPAYSENEKNFLLSGTNIATALFMPLFLLSFLHPATTSFYLLCFFVLLAAQYVFWFIDRTPTKGTKWPMVGVGSGLLVPITVGLCAHFARGFQWAPFESAPHELVHVLEVAASPVPALGYLTERLIRHLITKREENPGESWLRAFLTPFPSICITGLLSGLLSICLTIFGGIMHFANATDVRLVTLITTYLFITYICAAAIGINHLSKMLSRKESSHDGSSLDSLQQGPNYRTITDLVLGLIHLTRPFSAAMAGLLTMLIALPNGPLFASRAALAMTLVVMFGFVVDNIADYRDDILAGVKTPLTAGTISRPIAAATAVLVSVAALLVAPGRLASVVILWLAISVLMLYPYFSRVFPLFKGVYTGCLVCLPLLYPSLLTDRKVPLRYYLVIFAFIVAREAYIDSYQSKADTTTGRRTLAVVWNSKTVKKYAAYAMVLTVVFLIAVVRGEAAKATAIMSLVTVLLVLYSPLIPDRRSGWLRAPMVLGILALALSL